MKVLLVFAGFLLLAVVHADYSYSRYHRSMDAKKLNGKFKPRPRPKPLQKCWTPLLEKAVYSLRGFPADASVMEMQYEPEVYYKMLETFWASKDTDLRGAYKMFYTEFTTQLLQRRYQCAGTKFNQILIYVVDREARPYLNRTVSSSIAPLLAKYPQLRERIVGFVQKIFDDDMLGFLEEEEFADIGCFLRDLGGAKFSEDMTSLEDLKAKFDEAVKNVEVFACTDPQEVLGFYKNGLDILDTPVRKNKLYWHLKRVLLKEFLRTGTADKAKFIDKAKFRLLKKLAKDLAFKMLEIFRGSVNHMRPVLKHDSEDQLLKFLGKFMSDEYLNRARAIVESMDLYPGDEVKDEVNRIFDEDRSPDQDGGSYDEDGGSYDEDGGSYDEDGGSYDEDGGSYDEDGGSYDEDDGGYDDDDGSGSYDDDGSGSYDDDDGSGSYDDDRSGDQDVDPTMPPSKRSETEKLRRALDILRKLQKENRHPHIHTRRPSKRTLDIFRNRLAEEEEISGHHQAQRGM